LNIQGLGVNLYVSVNFMKTLLSIVIFILLSCNNQTQQAAKVQPVDTVIKSVTPIKIDNSKHYITEDTISIATETVDTFKFGKEEFNRIIDEQPEFFDKYPSNPDLTYKCKVNRGEFSSEVGQDTYYVLYAYFLKQRNGFDKYSDRRSKLIKIYSSINSLFQSFQYGGTYFGHQYPRILGYAEYSVYLYSISNDHFEKTYDITKQKSLYIQSLRQLIEDESKIDFETLGKDKIARNAELNKTVDTIDKLITDIFYLRRAEEFQYVHYEYY
jgi:hypothetical protein